MKYSKMGPDNTIIFVKLLSFTVRILSEKQTRAEFLKNSKRIPKS